MQCFVIYAGLDYYKEKKKEQKEEKLGEEKVKRICWKPRHFANEKKEKKKIEKWNVFIIFVNK